MALAQTVFHPVVQTVRLDGQKTSWVMKSAALRPKHSLSSLVMVILPPLTFILMDFTEGQCKLYIPFKIYLH